MAGRHNNSFDIVFVALMSALGFVAIVFGTIGLERQGRAIHAAARDADLVRSIAAFAPFGAAPSARAETIVEAKQLAATDARLASGDTSLGPASWPPKSVRNLYAAAGRDAVRRYALAALSGDAAYVLAHAPAVEGLELRVERAYESAGAVRTREIAAAEACALALVVLVFAFDLAFVFRPMQRELEMQHGALAAQIAALDASEQRLSLLLAQLPAVVFTVGNDDRISSATGAALETLRIDARSLIGRDVRSVFDTEYAAAVGDQEDLHLRGRIGKRYFQIFVEPRAAGRNRLHGRAGIALDVTDRDEMLRELERSEARLARAQRTARAGVWELDLRTSAVSCTEQMYDLVGFADRSRVPELHQLMEFVHVDDRAMVLEVMQRARRERKTFTIDFRLVRGDGEICWVQQHGEYTYDERTKRATSFFGTALDITGRKRAEERLEHRALHDSLTDLPNRLLLLDRLDVAVERAKRSGNEGAVVFVDIDSFKDVNDTYGHLVGDLYLKEAAHRLRSFVRATDTVARNGGDEFVLLLENVGERPALEALLQTLVEALKQPYALGVQTLEGSASLGVCFFRDEGATPDDLIRSADAAMYHAKQAGGGDIRTYDARLRDQTEERLALEKDIRVASERSEFELAFQPIVDMAGGGRIASFEALLRWHHPTLGTIAPVRFIESIEANGLIVIVGEWVLRTACSTAKAWHEAGHPHLAIAVNVSARQLQSEGFVDMVARTLAQTGLNAASLELELTESALMDDIEKAIGTVRELRALGVRIAIDDFGTGYSSIAYLKYFNVDTVKIDRMFVRDLVEGRRESAIVRSITTLAHNLNCRVVAEGVETSEQAAMLRELDCDSLQGFFYGRPIAGHDLDYGRLNQLMYARWDDTVANAAGLRAV